jgi:hypothetical protein
MDFEEKWMKYYRLYNLAQFTENEMKYLVENDMISPFHTESQQKAIKELLRFNQKLGNIPKG